MINNSFYFVGSYTEDILHGTGEILHGKGEGIYLVKLDALSNRLEKITLSTKTRNPSFLCISSCKRFLYAVNELKEFQGNAEGSVSAFAIKEDGRKLTLLGEVGTGGMDPCHVAISNDGTNLIVSNFKSGSICLFEICKDGSLSGKRQFIQHSGSSVDPIRQKSPHAHSATFDYSKELVYVPDLGIDEIKVYRLDQRNHQLIAQPSFISPPGAGPRYCEINKNCDILYCVNELACTISVIKYDGKPLKEVQTVPLIQDAHIGDSIAAALHLSTDGENLYASVRGHNIIVHFVVQKDGMLSFSAQYYCGGHVPRDFTIDENAQHLLVANQDSHSLSLFQIHAEGGSLHLKDHLFIPTPVCVCQYK